MKSTCPNCDKIFTTEHGLKAHSNSCTPTVKAKWNWNNFLVATLAVLLFVNLLVMGFFAATVNSKLGEAIELTKPQEGTLTFITPTDCPKCRSFEGLRDYMVTKNVEFTEELTFSAESAEGQELISRMNFQKLPAVIFESEKKLKTAFKKALEEGGKTIGETVMVWEQNFPPYFDLNSNTAIGLVETIFITDKSCKDCYNVEQTQKLVLGNFGLVASEEKTVDISDAEGKELLKKYKITKVPTIILSKEAEFYEKLTSAWKQVGTIESDGSFVFREMDVIKVKYKDLGEE